MEKYDALDQKLLDTMDIIRETHGSCTAGQLASRLRMSKSSVVARCQALRDKGLVTWTPNAGSLRRVMDPRQRIYELLVLREIERIAATSQRDLISLSHDELIEQSFASQVVADARREAQLDPPAPVGVAPEGQPSSAESAGGTDPSAPTGVAEALRCETCDRTFANVFGRNGHFNSKAHAAAVAAAA